MKRSFRLCLLCLCCIFGLLLTACDTQADTSPAAGVTPTSAGPTPMPTFDLGTRMTDVRSAAVGVDDSDGVLAWIGQGIAPGSQTADAPGQVVLLRPDASATVLLDLPNGTQRVTACGDRATSPDGRYFAFYVGGENGRIYFMDGINPPAALEETHLLGCLGGGTFQYAPDSALVGYITYTSEALNATMAAGRLIVRSTADGAERARFDNTAAFDLLAGRAAYVTFLPISSNQNRATEAPVYLWEGRGQQGTEIATIFAAEDCYFTSAAVAFTGETTLAVLMGTRCAGRGTGFALHLVDLAARQETLALMGEAGGDFSNLTRTNVLFPAPDGAHLAYTVPDGIALNSVNLRTTPLLNPATADNLLVNLVMPRSSTNPYALTNNFTPQRSPDERWLAVTSSTPNNETTLNVVDLTADLPPFTLNPGNRGDTIAWVDFSGDSTEVLIVAGPNNRASNSLFRVDLTDFANATDTRVIRGRFWQVVAAPDGETAALTAWQSADQGTQRDYMTVDLVNVQSGTASTLFSGAILADGRATEHRFAWLLAWRRG